MKKLLCALLFSSCFFACKKGPVYNRVSLGYMYTSTNSSSGNSIVVLERKLDGAVQEVKNSPYPTGDLGDAAEGDFDTQWALRIVGNYLIAVNAGNNPTNGSLSVFKINRSNGELTQIDQNPSTPQIDNMDSRGVRPTSIAVSGSSDQKWIVVGNQYTNPNYQGDPAVAFGSVVNTDLRNLAVFTFNTANGLLEFKKIGATYNDGSHGGPTTAVFNASGTKLAVSTWGVAHFLTKDPDLSLQKPGRLYMYDFADGNLTQTGLYEETGVSGNIGVSWSPSGRYVYMANFNLHSAQLDNSVTVHDAKTAVKVQNFATGNTPDDEACWTHVSSDSRTLYVASFTGNNISAFSIGADDKLSVTLNPNFIKRSKVPSPDTKDMYEGSDGYLYVSGAFQSHSISIFKMNGNGSLTEQSGSPYHIPSSAGKTSDEQSFLGLTGYDKNLFSDKEAEE